MIMRNLPFDTFLLRKNTQDERSEFKMTKRRSSQDEWDLISLGTKPLGRALGVAMTFALFIFNSTSASFF